MVHVDTASNTLLQYGAMGTVLAVLLGLFTWTFRVILIRFLRAFDGMLQALQELSREHAVHVTATADHHRAIMTASHVNHAAMMEKLDTMKRDIRERRVTKP